MYTLTPPMGWNTWNTFGPHIHEDLIKESVDAIVSSGLQKAGYQYVVIDDCWSLRERDKNGRLVADPAKFPHGMKALADYVHAHGLKFGMYSCAGYLTCAGYPASYEYEWVDAETFASWDVDFLKYDFCYHPMNDYPDVLYKRMGIALANCGRDILFSACCWGGGHVRQWIKETGAAMWRSTGDINDSWESIKSIAQSQLLFQEYNGQGCFNDMDMLVVGMSGKGNVAVTGCSFEEYKTHFSLWALLNSPLMIGCDVRSMTEETKTILMNEKVIGVSQDPAGRQPFFLNSDYITEAETRRYDEPYYKGRDLNFPIIGRYLCNGDIAIGFFNMHDGEQGNYFPLEMAGIPATSKKRLLLTDLWTGEQLESKNQIVSLNRPIPAHGCCMFRAKVVD